MDLNIQCWKCRRVITIKVDPMQHSRWKRGALIQDCFPKLTSDQRELMISKTCGHCYETLFKDTEDD